MKSILKYIFCLAAYYSGLVCLYRRLFGSRQSLILMYHRVVDDSEFDNCLSQQGMVVSKSIFAGQMKYLKKVFRIVTLDELIHGIENGSVEKKHCVVTFDDGWRDVYINAYGIMKDNLIPATIYLSTGFVGTTKLFWPEMLTHILINRARQMSTSADYNSLDNAAILLSINKDCALLAERILFSEDKTEKTRLIDKLIEFLKSLSSNERDRFIETLSSGFDEQDSELTRYILNWDEVREMAENGISFGSHTVSHALLPQIPEDDAKSEIIDSKKEIEKNLSQPCEHFAYPNGDWNDKIRTVIRDAGYKSAVLATRNDSQTDPFALGRINIHNGMSVSPFGGFSRAVFATAISGFFDLIRKQAEDTKY